MLPVDSCEVALFEGISNDMADEMSVDNIASMIKKKKGAELYSAHKDRVAG